MTSRAASDVLPAHLRERVLEPTPDRPVAEGQFILYWMHHAARGHDNAALDAAIEVGNALRRPVLVYQGLAGRHRFNGDRHHVFIMQGARDAAAELAARGIRHVFHLPEDPDDPSPLPALAARASLVVAEDFPAPPFPAWTDRLTARIACPLWSVDACCIVPMRTVTPYCDRAFRFRARTSERFAAALREPWRDVAPGVPPFTGDLPFEPVDLARADLCGLVAGCAIDHAIGPVHETPGGSRAGYARWKAFRHCGLGRYAQRRNDATDPDGVSRLSPYLHHGHVSPWRIARDAAATGGAGAEKFLDELLIWRELAHHICAHAGDRLETLEILPDWARTTLAAHADDPRDVVYSPETLARGRTGDRLWNAAQRSLLVRGELHNNVRMTWGKAIPGWTADPAEALRTLIDLNHRYALDGNDPNSYGGLLWCLGLADRPFRPERPVLGAVRPRPTREHAERLDLDRYEQLVTVPAPRRRSIAVIGAGIAGLAAARTLRDHGHAVVVFEKGRGPGGRTARRRAGQHRFDHGAQYFTVRDPRFARPVASWCRDGVVAPWTGRLVAIDEHGRSDEKDGDLRRYVGTPGMNALGRHLARDVELHCGRRVRCLERRNASLHVHVDDDDEPAGPFDVVIVTAPPPQAATLLAPVAADLAAEVAAVEMHPCWAVMAAIDERLPLDFDGAFVNHGPLSWIARDSSKPERPDGERWVLHAGAAWSRVHLEDDAGAVVDALLGALAEVGGLRPLEPSFTAAHRWRYAQPVEPLASPCRFDSTGTIGVAGDWCGGPRIEGAYLSGVAAAGRVLGRVVG